jgi:hypothetical protein
VSFELSAFRDQRSGTERNGADDLDLFPKKRGLIRGKKQIETNIGWWQGSGFRDQRGLVMCKQIGILILLWQKRGKIQLHLCAVLRVFNGGFIHLL